MKIAFYHGDHREDGFLARLGVVIIRMAQKGSRFSDSTHVEAILTESPDGSVTIGSATLRKENLTTGKNGVRIKEGVFLKPHNWRVYEVPERSDGFFDLKTMTNTLKNHDGERYDLWGAVASSVPSFLHSPGRWFCSKIVAKGLGFADPGQYNVSELEALVYTFGSDITEEFFNKKGVP